MISRKATGPTRVPRSQTARRLAVLATASVAIYALVGGTSLVAAASGAIWTTQETCNTPADQDAMALALLQWQGTWPWDGDPCVS